MTAMTSKKHYYEPLGAVKAECEAMYQHHICLNSGVKFPHLVIPTAEAAHEHIVVA